MTAKRFIFEQDGNFHTVIDTVENKPMGVFEFKENEFPVYACFHMIIDKMNELYEENQYLKSLKWNLDCINEISISMQQRQLLEEENEQLRNRINDWHKRTFKAHEYFNLLEKVIDDVCDDSISNKIWKEYEKKEKLIE